VAKLKVLVTALYNKVIKAYKKGDKAALRDAFEIEDEVDVVTSQMYERHILRLNDGKCTPSVGAQYLNLSVSVERIADHLLNVGKTIEKFS
jgi:phosphate:Na+ symporter